MVQAEKPKLTYFDLGGRAEAIRMLLNHAKVDFEDCRVTGQAWADLKANTAECPNGQVPVLKIDGKVLCQSSPILRHVGIKHGYYPAENAMACYDADLAIETINDFWNKEF